MGRISMPQGKGSQMHNRRDYKSIGHDIPDNIDQTKTQDNVVLVDMDIKEAYKEIFGDAVERYNDKQKRDDRKIADYYEKIEHSKNGEKLFYEDVLQWGKKEDFEADPQLREKTRDALKEYAEGFQERNPNLRVIGAYIHMDEASPHLHLDYVPVAHGYKTGMDTRNSLDKALAEQGIEVKDRKRTVKDKETGEEKEVELTEGRYNNRTMAWKDREREVFEGICRERGLEVEEKRQARGSLTVEEYKEAKERMVEPLREQVQALKEGGAYTNEQGEREFIGYTESIKHLESEQEHLSKNAFAYRDGGWFYDYEKEDGFEIPEGGIEQKIKDAETEAERITDEASEKAEQITKRANDHFDEMLDRVEAYETEQKAQIDLDIQKYAKEQKEAVQGELDGLRGQLDQTKDAINKNNGLIQGQVDRYQKNENTIKVQETAINAKTAQVKELDEQLTAKAASVERISKSFDRIAERVPEHDAPKPVIKAHKVIDQEKRLFQQEVSHKEYSVSIPAGSLEDAQAIQREIGDLYIKQYTKETFKDVSDASERQAKEQADRMLADAQERIRQADSVLAQQQQILQQANQQALRIKEKAERERTSILEQAKQKARDIVAKAQETLENLKSEIKQLFGKRDSLQDEVDHTIENAQLKAEAIIQEAHEQAGTEELYNAINERLGLIPLQEKVEARDRMESLFQECKPYMTANEIQAYKSLDTKALNQAWLDRTVNGPKASQNMAGPFYDLRKSAQAYSAIKDRHTDAKEVLQEIKDSLEQEHNMVHHISRGR